MMGKKVLVTGGSGYIGKYVVDALLDRGHMVIVASMPGEKINERALGRIMDNGQALAIFMRIYLRLKDLVF